MDYEEIHKYLNEHSPESMEFSYPDDRNYYCGTYNNKDGWVYIPEEITVQELDNIINSGIEFFNIKIDPPVDGVNVV